MSKAEASATPPTPAEDVKAVTATLDVAGERLILLGALAALPAVAAIVPDLIQLRDNGLLATYLLGTLLLLGNAAARGRFSIRARIALLILTQVAAAVAIVSQLGLQSPPSILGPIATLLTTVYFGVGRGAALALAFNVFFLMVGLLTLANSPAGPTLAVPGAGHGEFFRWLRLSSITAFSTACLLILGWALHGAFQEAVRRLLRRDELLEKQLALTTTDLRLALARARRSEEKIRDLACFDQLTGLDNRFAVEAYYERLIDHCAPPPDGHTLIAVSVDNFRELSADRDFEFGRLVLKIVAGLLLSAAGPDDMIARVGGGEFVLLLRTGGSEDLLAERLEQLDSALAPPLVIGHQAVTLKVRLGVARYPEDGKTFGLLYRAARLYPGRGLPQACPVATGADKLPPAL